MPEQPSDPLHYEMKIPPEPDPEKQREPEKPLSDQTEHESSTTGSSSAKNTNVVRGDDKPQARRGDR